MDEYQSFNVQNNERALEISKILIEAAKETHAVVLKSEAKCRDALDSIATHDKETMWKTLQKYIIQYADFINSISIFTGIGVQRVDSGFYERVSAAEVEKQLRNIIGFIYAKEAMESVSREAFKQCAKKLLKQSKHFDYKEWNCLFM